MWSTSRSIPSPRSPAVPRHKAPSPPRRRTGRTSRCRCRSAHPPPSHARPICSGWGKDGEYPAKRSAPEPPPRHRVSTRHGSPAPRLQRHRAPRRCRPSKAPRRLRRSTPAPRSARTGQGPAQRSAHPRHRVPGSCLSPLRHRLPTVPTGAARECPSTCQAPAPPKGRSAQSRCSRSDCSRRSSPSCREPRPAPPPPPGSG